MVNAGKAPAQGSIRVEREAQFLQRLQAFLRQRQAAQGGRRKARRQVRQTRPTLGRGLGAADAGLQAARKVNQSIRLYATGPIQQGRRQARGGLGQAALMDHDIALQPGAQTLRRQIEPLAGQC
jgi:hypothetical protein